jgi:hypothetical protein
MTPRPELTVGPPLPDAARRHPLAHQSGLQLLAQALSVSHLWTACNRRQRDVLVGLRPALAEALRGATEGAGLTLPHLPEAVHPLTRAALQKRGLVNESGRLTAAGGLVVHWWAKPRGGES